jgi:hypothetical protein
MMKAMRALTRCAAEGIEDIRLVASLVNGVESTEDRRVRVVSLTPSGART